MSFVYFFVEAANALSCYQCSMKYSNEECNTNASNYFMECQPTYDTCTTIVLKPGKSYTMLCNSILLIRSFVSSSPLKALFDQIIITKYCSKKKACELQQNYIHSLTPCQPNSEGRSWGCVSCCSDRDLCNVSESTCIRINYIYFLVLIFALCGSFEKRIVK